MGLVAFWRIVGPGYTWLASAVTLVFGIAAAIAVSGPLVWGGCALALAAGATARRPPAVVMLAGLSAVLFAVAAAQDGGALLAVSGAVFLGGVTSEMMLGHWYLIAPRLPRSALRALAVVGGAGAVFDAIVVAGRGAFPWASEDFIMGVAFVVLSATSLLLMAAVFFALRERGYSGVMAATGLSYLAVLTSIGSAVLGRALL
jgi:hypothetical protein